MQIQRIQTLYLLLAAIFTGLFCFLPYAVVSITEVESAKVLVSETPVLLIFNLTITILLLITIFMYRNLRQQIKMALLNIWLIVGSVITTLLYIYVGADNAVPAFDGGVILLVLAFGFAFGAYRRMKHDQKLLSSADRLR